MKIELVKATKEQNNRHYDNERKQYVGENFENGERIIMVDGIRWGRTIVTRHGVHGTKTVVQQHSGSVICDLKGDIAVRSQKRRGWYDAKENWQPTATRVLEMVNKMVADGQLRHPDVVKKEHEENNKRWRARIAEREKEKDEAFRARAVEAITAADYADKYGLVNQVVAAMKWAQTQ